ncbi:succinate dehydrogenase/fumarate reductase iron-sulfur subunit [Laspinema olomoucense]|uniref:succinate dehydrogenase/fumarate reductase iron-sulfur subunit n=1 Tax=Laspinema olomoucense TaxID=3231600 RepID=UPI0021BB0E08|nr:succinate dehydrogenase/fumarate reductase iron-sulfur subunit [Laspinema sp. D3d]MCT7970792.1 succinate dehydrogenase/fumarate reductase iron-sulfur subunit [Laspinema sp. D3d]
MQVLFKIVRQSQNTGPRIQTYQLDVEAGNTILDCLNRIKWEQDGTLAFRKNCRNTICGSCSMRINGRSALACKENIGAELARLNQIAEQSTETGSATGVLDQTENSALNALPGAPPRATAPGAIPEITIAPMGNMPVVKDLVVDMQRFWNNLEAVDPYVSNSARKIPEREFLQTPEERSRLEESGNCILCGACYSECNAVEVNPQFVGPHALAKAYRMVEDDRDDQTESRLKNYNQTNSGVWSCTRCFYCNSVCPMGVEPLDKIGKIKDEILDRNDAQASRPIRHRKVLIDLVKKGGWVDERKFAVMVVGNFFRDIKGLLSLAPVGFQSIKRGKLPITFEPSEGTKEVRSLIESVQALESKSSKAPKK